MIGWREGWATLRSSFYRFYTQLGDGQRISKLTRFPKGISCQTALKCLPFHIKMWPQIMAVNNRLKRGDLVVLT